MFCAYMCYMNMESKQHFYSLMIIILINHAAVLFPIMLPMKHNTVELCYNMFSCSDST